MNRAEFVAYAREEYRPYKELPKDELTAMAEQWQIETMLHEEGKGRSGGQSRDELSAAAIMTKVGRQLQELVRRLSLLVYHLT